MSAELSVAGVTAGIQAIIDHPDDIRTPVLARLQI